MNEDDFKFEFDAPRKRISDQDILDSLQKLYSQIGQQPFTTTEYDKWAERICHSCTVSKRFGSWREALKRIGISKGVQAREYSPKELMDNLENVWRILGQRPSKQNLSKHGYGISERPYINRWGSVKNACLLLSQYMNGKISENRLFAEEKQVIRRKTISLKDRWKVLKRDNYCCVQCGSRPPDIVLEIDHIVPLARGGNDSLDNLQTLCNRCNQGKNDRLE